MFKDSLQGKEFLNFSAQQFNAEMADLKSLKGNVIVLNFWFVGCPPCMGEIGDFNNVFNHFKDSSVRILSLANNTREQIAKFIDGKNLKPIEKIQYPIIPDASDIIKQYHVSSYPTTVFIDKKGIIRLVYSGTQQVQMDALLIELIDDLLKE